MGDGAYFRVSVLRGVEESVNDEGAIEISFTLLHASVE